MIRQKSVYRLTASSRGQTMAEYALVLGAVFVLCAALYNFLGSNIVDTMLITVNGLF